MKYALVDGTRTEASKEGKGICPSCSSEVIAKCGKQRINHWAHKGKRSCDPWWEPETEWHRSWKNKFPANWQEVTHVDEQSTERHIADILTSHGLVLEFQHSHIKYDERLAREKFYKNMIWVIDGTRLKLDYPRFAKAIESFQIVKKQVYRVDFPEECFPTDWLNSAVPVIIDFLDREISYELNENKRKPLYCLFPVKIGKSAIVADIPRTTFVKTIINGQWLERARKFMEEIIQVRNEWQERKDTIERQRANMIFNNLVVGKKYRKSRPL